MLQTHRNADHVGLDAGGHLLWGVELAVGGARRVADQRARVADIDEMTHELRTFDELHPALKATRGASRSRLDTEGQQEEKINFRLDTDFYRSLNSNSPYLEKKQEVQ